MFFAIAEPFTARSASFPGLPYRNQNSSRNGRPRRPGQQRGDRASRGGLSVRANYGNVRALPFSNPGACYTIVRGTNRLPLLSGLGSRAGRPTLSGSFGRELAPKGV